MGFEDEYKKVKLWEILVPTVMERQFQRTVMKGKGKKKKVSVTQKNWPISTKYHRVWDKKVLEMTGGLTVYRPAKGGWVSPAGTTINERMIPVRIACTEHVMRCIATHTLEYYRQEEVMWYLVSDDVRFEKRIPKGQVVATFQRANGLVEDSCAHGVGHPNKKLTPEKYYYGTHGCDGCCGHPDWSPGVELDSGNIPFAEGAKYL